MGKIKNYDEDQRNKFSYWFRAILISFAWYLIVYSDNVFQWYVYCAASVAYFGVFIFLKRRNYSVLRMLNDFLYIFLIIWEKEAGNPLTLIFITIPLINAPNHSGSRGSPVLLSLLSFAVLAYLVRGSTYFNSADVNLYAFLMIPLVLVIVIVGFEGYRAHFMRFNDQLNDKIEIYYSDHLNKIPEPNKMLRDVVAIINSEESKQFHAKMLLCLKLEHKRMILVASSQFISSYRIINKLEVLTDLETAGICLSAQVEVDGNLYATSSAHIVTSDRGSLVYILISNLATIASYIQPLRATFTRISNILVFEDFLSEQKAKYLEKLKNKIEFMDDAQMSMHFIKNKLGPINGFIEMCSDYNEPPPEKAWRDHIVKERDKAAANIKLIIEKAEAFHRNVDSIFSFTEYQNVSVTSLVNLLRKSWSAYFSDEMISISISQDSKYLVEMNEDLLEIYFNNWVSNMFKYHDSKALLDITEEPGQIRILFSNDVPANGLQNATAFVDDFNSEGKAEIIKKSSPTQGLRELRYLTREMELLVNLLIESNTIIFELKFAKK